MRPRGTPICLAQSRAPITQAGFLAYGSSPLGILLSHLSQDSVIFTNQIPVYSGATAADSHRFARLNRNDTWNVLQVFKASYS